MAHVLVIDDSPTELSVAKGMLEELGHRVSAANSGEEGIALAASLKPDLILMDVVMPGMSGFQATRKLTRNPATAGIPVVIASVKNAESDKMWGLQQGAKDYLIKPYSAETLSEALERTLGVV